MTVKSPSEWLNFVARLSGATRVTLVGPLHHETFNPVEPTIFIDGGARFRSADPEKFPCISVGDGDSGDSPLDVKLPAEKDFSDLAFVLRELPDYVKNLRLVGFLGGRLDHELANLGELHQFLAGRSADARVDMENGGRANVIGFNGHLEHKIQGLFSILVLESAEVQITGECRYALNKATTLEPASSHGLSNEGNGLVKLSSSGPAFLFLP